MVVKSKKSTVYVYLRPGNLSLSGQCHFILQRAPLKGATRPRPGQQGAWPLCTSRPDFLL